MHVLTTCIQAARDPDEEGDYMAFEQLMADAAMKKDKKDTKDPKKDKPKKDEKKEDAAAAHHHHHNPLHPHGKEEAKSST